MKVLFVRPPRRFWPLMSPAGAYWQPLAFLCLAAQVRRQWPQLTVEIIDAPIFEMGWRRLAAELQSARPDVLCIGDEVSAAHEGLRLARLARSQNPAVRIVAGGYFFGWMAEEILAAEPIDFIARGEGELTIVRILERLAAEEHDSSAVANGSAVPIPGAIYRAADGRLIDGGWPDLIDDLDRLPMPAWDLVPMTRYGRGSRSHRQMATIEHSRGCVDSCDFCVLWRQMGTPAVAGADPAAIKPCWRTKSPERTFDEVKFLYERHGRRTFCWTDPTWNASPPWTDRFCDLLLRWGRPIEMVAWLRADGVVRDEGLGLLEKEVRAGLRRVMMGLERPSDDELATLGKHASGPDLGRQAVAILGRYPQVYTFASLLFGLPRETPASLDRLVRYGGLADATIFLPLTPNPGTPPWRAARREGRLATEDFARYNFLNPVLRTDRYEPAELMKLYSRAVARNTFRSAGWWLRNFRRSSNRGKGGLALRLGWRAARIAVGGFFSRQPVLDRRPRWYDD